MIEAPALALEPATRADLPEIAALMNRAYRDPANPREWASESAYITGLRTSAELLAEDLDAAPKDAALLIWREAGTIIGCALISPEDAGTWYLGSFTIDPSRQGQGLGARLLAATEAEAARRGASRIRMTVVHLRQGLIAWYARHGYRPTGETAPFPYGDDRFGTPLRGDLAFAILAKDLPLRA